MAAKLTAATTMIVIFVVALLAINVVHFRVFTVSVVLYATVLDAFLALVVAIAAYLALFGRRGPLSGFEAVLTGAICLLGGYAFAISVPTVVDRSLSIYILEKLDQRGGAIRQDAFADIFRDEYLPEHRLVDVRLTEQLASGTIVIDDGCVRLTDRGRRIVGFSRFYRTSILPRNRILMGETTDDLTDPFRASAAAASYLCDP